MPRITIAAASILLGGLLMPQAHAQCPAGTVNPLQTLVGAWTFTTKGFAFPPTVFLAAGGRFVATVAMDRSGAPLGTLSVTQTASMDGTPARLETDIGTFQVNPDCSGGTLTFNISSRPVQFDFFTVNANQIFLVGTNAGDIIAGIANRTAPALVAPVCPANPLQVLVGTWAFVTNGFTFPPTRFLAAGGRFTATIGVDRSGAPLGILSITQTSSTNGVPVRLETDAGRYQLNADCSGGTLTFNVSTRPVQLDFILTSPNELVIVGTNPTDFVDGLARRVTP
jgi:hypothetical protein